MQNTPKTKMMRRTRGAKHAFQYKHCDNAPKKDASNKLTYFAGFFDSSSSKTCLFSGTLNLRERKLFNLLKAWHGTRKKVCKSDGNRVNAIHSGECYNV